MLQRMNVLSVQAANGTNSQSDRRSIQAEIDQLNKEIDRIGETTSFNGTYIFKDLDGETKNREHEVIDLMSCPSAEEGYLREAYKVGSSYHPAGTINFKNINGGNLNYILGSQFTFTCSQSCPEAFEFELVNGPSSATDLSGKVTHKYKIGIGNCTSAEDIVDTVYDYVRNNLPDTVPQNPASGGPIGVSHSNMMTKSPDGRSLIIYATSKAKPTPEEAANVYQTGPYGRVTSSYVTMEGDKGEAKNYFKIQCSGVDFDQEMIYTRVINSDMLGTDGINLLAKYGPERAIYKVSHALELVSSHRSELGAFQNRLEHAMAINDNTCENTTSAESLIRDTDMAKEMVESAKLNILSQAGLAMMAQANQSRDSVMNLLQ